MKDTNMISIESECDVEEWYSSEVTLNSPKDSIKFENFLLKDKGNARKVHISESISWWSSCSCFNDDSQDESVSSLRSGESELQIFSSADIKIIEKDSPWFENKANSLLNQKFTKTEDLTRKWSLLYQKKQKMSSKKILLEIN